MSQKIGLISGSFDPITNGHTWMISQASQVLSGEKLIIAISANISKHCRFSLDQRKRQVEQVLQKHNLPCEIEIVVLPSDRFLIDFAQEKDVNFIIRGIRNTSDFIYEQQICEVQRKINPNIETMFFISPAKDAETSSSLVKGFVGLKNWEHVVSQYVDPIIVNDFRIL
jgi:pantetheine-phosphate adenylyltransferase